MTTRVDDWPMGDDPRPAGRVRGALFDLVMHLPGTSEPKSATPQTRARAIRLAAARKAAAISGALALPPGPLGLLTILPDLIAIWRIQQQMIVDLAAAFGFRAHLRREVMIYCLFKHGAAAVLRDLVVRVGERVFVREVTTRVVQQTLQKIGIKVTQRVVGRSLTRWIPVVGALGTGAYAFYDTKQVGLTAIELFSQFAGQRGTPPPLPMFPESTSS
jgi:hypothetical protein